MNGGGVLIAHIAHHASLVTRFGHLWDVPGWTYVRTSRNWTCEGPAIIVLLLHVRIVRSKELFDTTLSPPRQ